MAFYLINNKKTLNPKFLQLLNLLGVAHSNTLESIIANTQSLWLRPKNTVRWHLNDKLELHIPQAIALFKELQLIDAVLPQKKQYDYAIILGTTNYDMRYRLSYLLFCWNKGVLVNKIIFLTSDRPLDPNEEPIEQRINPSLYSHLPYKKNWPTTTNTPTTEYEMAQAIYFQTDLPENLARIPVEFICTPHTQLNDGTLVLPNTGDTFKTWLATHPTPGSCLAFSDQPFIGYQQSVLSTYAPKEFSVETVGPICAYQLNITQVLDTLARWAYQENIRIQHL